MRWLIFFLAMMLIPGLNPQAFCQSDFSTRNPLARRSMERAVEAYQSGNYELALTRASQAIRRDPGFREAHILKAEVFFTMGDHHESANAYRLAIGLDPEAYPQARYYLGLSLIHTGQYAEARKWIEEFLAFPSIPPSLEKSTRELMAQCDFALAAMDHPVPFSPENLGGGVNSPTAEYSPALTIDGKTLVFTRRSPGGAGREAGRETEDFYVSRWESGQWSPAVNLGPPINTEGNEGAQSLSADGQTMYFTACGRSGGQGSCDIYFARMENGRWGQARNMGRVVNSAAWDSHPSVSSDGKTLYFSSARAGSHGPMDLWKTDWDENLGWQTPVNLGPDINTTGREMSPFIHPDGQTLYFASDGHQGMGGLDIFLSRRDAEGNWSSPVNLGYPINTHADEFSLFVDAGGSRAYFASDIEGGCGDLDIYSFELYEEARPKPVVGIVGLAGGGDEPESMKVIGEGDPVVLRNIFFDTDSYRLKPESMEEIRLLFGLLKDHPGWKVEISGHTDNVGGDAYNLALSENRARSVVQALVDMGIDPSRLTYKGHADTRPVDTNETAGGRANNRRTEFTILKF
ncbi:MAG: OmpA family protein [Bacteroidales bacterium]